jgi:ribonuclease Y
MNINPLWLGLLFVGLAIGYFIRLFVASQRKDSAERKIQESIAEAEAQTKEIIISAKGQAAVILEEAAKEERVRKQELRRFEERLLKKEDAFDQARRAVEAEIAQARREEERFRLASLDFASRSGKLEEELKKIQERAVQELEKAAGFTREEAKSKLFEEIQAQHREELAELLIRCERENREQAEAKSMEIIASAIQRYARNHIADITTTIVNLSDEDIKGKIIGREGRNIRTFERLTGVEVIVDETPESILLSSFDPLRREIARIALEKLIRDGRIQPAKIEEKVEEAKQEIEERILKIGEEAAYEVGILDLPKEILSLLGRLNYRTSYGQNVLVHSIEMTHIAGMIAAELGLRVDIAKKGALIHDIGKAIDHEVEGTHIEIGRRLLKKYGIEEEVTRAMEAHHEEYPFATPESYVVAAADAISAARPGARRDTLEKYLRRLEEMEKIVTSFEGVNQAYAVSAGREVRVFVVPEKIDDFGALALAKNIAAKIKSDLRYPGEIKVTVIREVKAVEYAR